MPNIADRDHASQGADTMPRRVVDILSMPIRRSIAFEGRRRYNASALLRAR